VFAKGGKEMDSVLSACGMGGVMQGPAIAVMAAGAGLSVLLWLIAIVLGVVGIVWLVRNLRSKPEPPGADALAQARS
jgi:Flp pilus assembly protein TadB